MESLKIGLISNVQHGRPTRPGPPSSSHTWTTRKLPVTLNIFVLVFKKYIIFNYFNT